MLLFLENKQNSWLVLEILIFPVANIFCVNVILLKMGKSHYFFRLVEVQTFPAANILNAWYILYAYFLHKYAISSPKNSKTHD